LLRPLSDLTKEIEHNGEKFVPLRVLNEYMPLFGDVYEIYIDDNSDVRLLANYQKGRDVIRGFDAKNMLMKMHLDTEGLLDKNLAINLNEVKCRKQLKPLKKELISFIKKLMKVKLRLTSPKWFVITHLQ